MSDMNQMPSEQAALDTALASEGGSGTNRRLLFVLGGAALVVVLLGGFFLLHSGGGSSQDTGLVPSAVQPTGAGKPSASPSPSGNGQTVPAVYHGKVGRNPFKPLAAEAVPSSSPTPTGTAASPTPTSGGTTPTAVSTYQVLLKSADVAGQKASFYVNGTLYSNVAVGDTFASVFRLDSVAGSKKSPYVTLTYGDVAIPGHLFVGQTLTGP